ncbi:hypothetical protein [uncultured Roseobacter sp.]|uniref:hypothetical protein n=1 Tax=uncultured Roseobacter sp. TaxID=114847 RepID=UPI0026309F48|nr:hypothetical protein [uncultured Roseobacter sp.]
MTKTAFFVTELGGGLGHFSRLNAMASIAREMGFRTVLVYCSRDLPDHLVSGWSFDSVLRGPDFPRLVKSPDMLNVGGLAGNLARVGLVDSETITSVVSGWHTLFREENPSVVVGDFSPYARISSLGRLPFVMVGSGYTLPTSNGLLPFELQPKKRDPKQVVERIVSQVNDALRNMGSGDIENAGQCLRGDQNLVACLPFLDPAANRDVSEYVGPMEALPKGTGTSTDGLNIYGYFHNLTPLDQAVLRNLLSLGCKVDLFCDADRTSGAEGVTVLDSPQTPTEIIQNYQMVTHQAGLGLSTMALLAGIPQLLSPKHTEGHMTALRLQEKGVGYVVSDEVTASRPGIGAHIKALNTPKTIKNIRETAISARGWVAAIDCRGRVFSALNELS